jgi:hypothetical protein
MQLTLSVHNSHRRHHLWAHDETHKIVSKKVETLGASIKL